MRNRIKSMLDQLSQGLTKIRKLLFRTLCSNFVKQAATRFVTAFLVAICMSQIDVSSLNDTELDEPSIRFEYYQLHTGLGVE